MTDEARWFRVREELHDEVRRRGERDLARRLSFTVEALRSALRNEGDPGLRDILQEINLRYADLEQFLSSYLYESYDAETGSLQAWEPAVDQFLTFAEAETIAGTLADIRTLIEDVPGDREIAAKLKDLGCRFSFRMYHDTPSGWIRRVAERLERGLNGPP